ncbi:MAG: DALR domain-containing protein, partial [Myxococcales bacterium]
RRIDYLYDTLAKVQERLEGKEVTPGPLHRPEVAEAVLPAFRESMADDFNTAQVLGQLAEPFNLMNELCEKPPVKDKAQVVRTLARLRDDVLQVGKVLGLFELEPRVYLDRRRERAAQQKGIDKQKVEALIQARADARRNKNFAEADRVRDELKAMGVEIMDGPSGTTWKVLA